MLIRYFDIAWMSRYDGPGLRVVLFLQGCHLRCPWCHSPHSWHRRSPLLFFPNRCLLCGTCAKVCPQSVHRLSAEGHHLDRKRCKRCGQCVAACPVSSVGTVGGALALPTVEASIDSLWELLYPQLALVRNIGGITFSGGEALLQVKAVRQLLLRCQEADLHTAVETSGTLPPARIAAVAELVDCWLFGLRPTEFYPAAAKYEGRIQENLRLLAAGNRPIIIRTPIIAGITDAPASLAAIAESMRANRLTEIQLLPFNPQTAHYYCALDQNCPVGMQANPSDARMGDIRQYFCDRGINAT